MYLHIYDMFGTLYNKMFCIRTLQNFTSLLNYSSSTSNIISFAELLQRINNASIVTVNYALQPQSLKNQLV